MGYTNVSIFFSLFFVLFVSNKGFTHDSSTHTQSGSHTRLAPFVVEAVHASLRMLQLAPLSPSRSLPWAPSPSQRGSGWDGTNQRRKGHRSRRGLTLFDHPSSQENLRAGFDQPNPKQGSYSNFGRVQSAGFHKGFLRLNH